LARPIQQYVPLPKGFRTSTGAEPQCVRYGCKRQPLYMVARKSTFDRRYFRASNVFSSDYGIHTYCCPDHVPASARERVKRTVS